jgi:hypothetical protein
MGPTHTAIQWVRGSFPGIKRQRYAVDSSPPSIAEVKNASKYATLLHRHLWRAKEQLYFLSFISILVQNCDLEFAMNEVRDNLF